VCTIPIAPTLLGGELPQARGGVLIHRVRGDAAPDAITLRKGLVAVLEVAAGDALDER
jgi:hypothetical protein